VYRIEPASYGLRLIFTGTMSFDEVERWSCDIDAALKRLPKSFGVFVDMRGLVPLLPEAHGALRQGQLYARHLGMQRSVVIVDSVAVADQFERIAREIRINACERYIDALSEPNWEQIGVDWIVDGIDPDVGRKTRRTTAALE
jgi:hypothetical protein